MEVLIAMSENYSKPRDKVWESIKPTVRLTAKTVLKQHQDLVDEVVNEVYLRFRVAKKSPDSSVSWCTTVARRHAVKLYKERQSVYSNDALLSLTAGLSPRQHLEQKEKLEVLQRLLNVVDVGLKNVADKDDLLLYQLHVVEECTWKEVAQRMELTPACAQKRYCRFLRNSVAYIRRLVLADDELREYFEDVLASPEHFRQSLVRLLRYLAKHGVALLG